MSEARRFFQEQKLGKERKKRGFTQESEGEKRRDKEGQGSNEEEEKKGIRKKYFALKILLLSTDIFYNRRIR